MERKEENYSFPSFLSPFPATSAKIKINLFLKVRKIGTCEPFAEKMLAF
jgi:hypothetical protein